MSHYHASYFTSQKPQPIATRMTDPEIADALFAKVDQLVISGIEEVASYNLIDKNNASIEFKSGNHVACWLCNCSLFQG